MAEFGLIRRERLNSPLTSGLRHVPDRECGHPEDLRVVGRALNDAPGESYSLGTDRVILLSHPWKRHWARQYEAAAMAGA